MVINRYSAARLTYVISAAEKGRGIVTDPAPSIAYADYGLAEVARHIVEGAAQLRTDAGHRDRGNRNQRCNQAIFDRGRATLVTDEFEKLGHVIPLGRRPTLCGRGVK